MKSIKFPTKKEFIEWLKTKPKRKKYKGDANTCFLCGFLKEMRSAKYPSVRFDTYDTDHSSEKKVPLWAEKFQRELYTDPDDDIDLVTEDGKSVSRTVSSALKAIGA